MSRMCGLTPGHPTKQQEGHINTSKGGKSIEAGRAGKRVRTEVTVAREPSLPLFSVGGLVTDNTGWSAHIPPVSI